MPNMVKMTLGGGDNVKRSRQGLAGRGKFNSETSLIAGYSVPTKAQKSTCSPPGANVPPETYVNILSREREKFLIG